MKQDRGHAPFPIAAETTVVVVVTLVCLLVLGVHAGRTVATGLAGEGLVWPAPQEVLVSVPAVLGGDPHAGLPVQTSTPDTSTRGTAGPSIALLRWSIAVVELTLLVLAGCAAAAGLDRWGPARMKGVASREETEAVLGVSRLRKVKTVVRPDLHGSPGPRSARNRPQKNGRRSLARQAGRGRDAARHDHDEPSTPKVEEIER